MEDCFLLPFRTGLGRQDVATWPRQMKQDVFLCVLDTSVANEVHDVTDNRSFAGRALCGWVKFCPDIRCNEVIDVAAFNSSLSFQSVLRLSRQCRMFEETAVPYQLSGCVSILTLRR